MRTSAAEQIKERLDIVEVVGQYVKLTKSGKNFKGLSPFKKEKTPSFYVSPDRGVYYCFSTGKGGDMFTFLEEMEGVDFRGALKILAERAGVELSEESKEVRSERDRSYAMVDEAVRFYQKALDAAPHAREYLKGRGITDETMASFRIGFAPDGWEALKLHLSALGYQEHEMERAGLVKKGDRGSYYDRFRSRVMFPINDASGRPIGFSGRIVGKAAEDKENAKYLNSPESALYDKSSVLFGYDKAKSYIRKYDFSILVEGQMDLVMTHQAGWGSAVAVSGTGLTERHLELLARLSKNLVLALDADSAGIASAHRSSLMAITKGMEVKIAVLPEGMDPADLIGKDPEAWRGAVRNAESAVEFFLKRHQLSERDPRKVQTRVRETVLPLIRAMKSAMDQAHFVKRVADALGLPYDAVWSDLSAVPVPSSGSHEESALSSDTGSAPLTPKERYLRLLMGAAAARPDPTLEAEIETAANEPFMEIKSRLEPLLNELAMRYEKEFVESGVSEEKVFTKSLTVKLAGEVLKEARSETISKIREAELLKDEELIAQLQGKVMEISRKIEALAAD